MAIQNRRGNTADFDPNKMLPGEFAYALDTGELYYCVSPGNVKRCATKEELQQILTSTPEAYTALQQLISELENQTVLTGILADISELKTERGVPLGTATLDESGKIYANQLPSYVDDVIEVDTYAELPTTGETGKIYVVLTGDEANRTYRWSGTAYSEISQSLAIGEVAGTAFEGNRGKALETGLATANDSLANLDIELDNIFIKRRFTNTITVGALNVVNNTSVTIDTIAGYTPIEFIVQNAHPSNTLCSLSFASATSVAIGYITKLAGSEQFLVDVVYAKTVFIGS